MIGLQSYRWLSLQCFRFDHNSDEVSPDLVLNDLLADAVYQQPYVDLGIQEPVHGPSLANRISSKSFIKQTFDEASKSLLLILNDPDWCDPPELPSNESIELAQNYLHTISGETVSCFRLNLDPLEDKEFRHEQGWVISEFQEFIFIEHFERRLHLVVVGFD